MLRPRNWIKHYITRDNRPLWGLPTACAAMVCAVVPPVIASRPTYRQVRVFENQDLSRHILDTHQAKSASEHGLHEARHHERLRRSQDTRPVWEMSTACAAVVCTVVPPVIASRPICRRVRVLDTQDISTGIAWGHIKLNVPAKIYMKHATTAAHIVNHP